MGKFYHALLKVIDWKTAKNLHFFIFHWFLFNFRSQLFSELGHKGCNKRHSGIRSGICPIYINVSLVVDFQRWWVLKSKKGFYLKSVNELFTVHQKLTRLYFQSQFLM